MNSRQAANSKSKAKRREVALVHPGEILLTEFLGALGISQYRLAKDICVPPRRINEIIKGMRGISTDTALRLSLYFNTTAEFWMNLQCHYDLVTLRERHGAKIEREVSPRSTEAA